MKATVRSRTAPLIIAVLTATACGGEHSIPPSGGSKSQGLSPSIQVPRDNRLVIKFREGSRVRLRDGLLTDLLGQDVSKVRATLAAFPNGRLERLFQAPEDTIDRERTEAEASSADRLVDLNQYYSLAFPVAVSNREKLQSLTDRLTESDLVELAYVEATPQEARADIAPVTPNIAGQGYLDPAPNGVDALYAATQAGGQGSGVNFIDVEFAWTLSHEDFRDAAVFTCNPPSLPYNPPCIPLGPSNGLGDPNHGTAVLGEVIGDPNGFGITGIAPGAHYSVVSAAQVSVADAINVAARYLTSGDVLLIELHIPGPATGTACVCNCGQYGYVPVEWERATFDAIKSASAKGILVVEAGGNGSVNLDDPRYYTCYAAPGPYPPPPTCGGAFDRSVRDSGAVLVAASLSTGRSPTCWTNFGSRIDVHGWGENVTTTGYGDRFNGLLNGVSDPRQFYTNIFSGTSSASPIVAGAVLSIQGFMKLRWGVPLSPTEARKLISGTGTLQDPGTVSRRIGPLPDLRRALNATCTRPPVYGPNGPVPGPVVCN